MKLIELLKEDIEPDFYDTQPPNDIYAAGMNGYYREDKSEKDLNVRYDALYAMCKEGGSEKYVKVPFNYKRGLEALEGTKYYKWALKDWPKGFEDTKTAIQKQKENSKPMPEKKFKLKEDTEAKDYYNTHSPSTIFISGINGYYYEDKSYEDPSERYNPLYGFYKKGNAFGYVKVPFDYKKGLEALKGTEYYEHALSKWPKGYDETKTAIEDQKKNSKPMRDKRFKL
jgi:hypothetical protein